MYHVAASVYISIYIYILYTHTHACMLYIVEIRNKSPPDWCIPSLEVPRKNLGCTPVLLEIRGNIRYHTVIVHVDTRGTSL